MFEHRDRASSECLVGELELGAEVHRGALSAVRVASSGSTARPMAARVLNGASAADGEVAQLLAREHELGRRISSANLLRYYQATRLPAGVITLMERVEGLSLDTLLKRTDPHGAPRLLTLAVIDGLRGLAALHAAAEPDGDLGVVHQAPVPRHLMVGVDGVTRLVDLTQCVSRLHPWSPRLSQRLRAHELSPDQVLAPARIDARSDVFVMGSTLWRVLTGKVLFEASNDEDAIQQVLRAPLPSLAEAGFTAGLRIERIIRSMLARTRSDRPGSAAELAQELEAAATQAGLLGTREELAELVRVALRARALPPGEGVASPPVKTYAATLVGVGAVDDGVRVQLQRVAGYPAPAAAAPAQSNAAVPEVRSPASRLVGSQFAARPALPYPTQYSFRGEPHASSDARSEALLGETTLMETPDAGPRGSTGSEHPPGRAAPVNQSESRPWVPALPSWRSPPRGAAWRAWQGRVALAATILLASGSTAWVTHARRASRAAEAAHPSASEARLSQQAARDPAPSPVHAERERPPSASAGSLLDHFQAELGTLPSESGRTASAGEPRPSRSPAPAASRRPAGARAPQDARRGAAPSLPRNPY
jgi:Protein kinase domain